MSDELTPAQTTAEMAPMVFEISATCVTWRRNARVGLFGSNPDDLAGNTGLGYPLDRISHTSPWRISFIHQLVSNGQLAKGTKFVFHCTTCDFKTSRQSRIKYRHARRLAEIPERTEEVAEAAEASGLLPAADIVGETAADVVSEINSIIQEEAPPVPESANPIEKEFSRLRTRGVVERTDKALDDSTVDGSHLQDSPTPAVDGASDPNPVEGKPAGPYVTIHDATFEQRTRSEAVAKAEAAPSDEIQLQASPATLNVGGASTPEDDLLTCNWCPNGDKFQSTNEDNLLSHILGAHGVHHNHPPPSAPSARRSVARVARDTGADDNVTSSGSSSRNRKKRERKDKPSKVKSSSKRTRVHLSPEEIRRTIDKVCAQVQRGVHPPEVTRRFDQDPTRSAARSQATRRSPRQSSILRHVARKAPPTPASPKSIAQPVVKPVVDLTQSDEEDWANLTLESVDSTEDELLLADQIKKEPVDSPQQRPPSVVPAQQELDSEEGSDLDVLGSSGSGSASSSDDDAPQQKRQRQEVYVPTERRWLDPGPLPVDDWRHEECHATGQRFLPYAQSLLARGPVTEWVPPEVEETRKGRRWYCPIRHCRKTGINFPLYESWARHYRTRHLRVNEYVCRLCGKQYLLVNHLTRHLVDKHREDPGCTHWRLILDKTCKRVFHPTLHDPPRDPEDRTLRARDGRFMGSVAKKRRHH